MEISQENITKLFCNLSTLPHSRIYKHLTHIRLKVCNSEEGASAVSKSNNALEVLINLLNESNGRIIDVTLSILTFCCLKDPDVISKVSSLEIAKPLSSVFVNMKRDCIVGRACRLVGNLSQVNLAGKNLLEEGIAKHLVEVLNNTSGSFSNDTVIMAMRACRILWKADIECELISCGFLKSVTQYLDVMKENDKLLVENALKTMLEITSQPSDICLGQITVHSAHKCLVELVQDEKFQDSAMKCIENLSDNRKMRSELGNAGLITLIITKLNQDLSSGCVSHISNRLTVILRKLSSESVNRAKIRLEGGLPLFMKILKDKKKFSVLLPALLSFLYDDLSLQVLLSDGLVDILIDVLITYVTDHGRTHSVKPIEDVPDTSRPIYSCYYPSHKKGFSRLWDKNSKEENVLSSVFGVTSLDADVTVLGVTSPDDDVAYSQQIYNLDTGEIALGNVETQSRPIKHLDGQVMNALLLLFRISQFNQFVEKMATRKTFVAILNYLTLADKPHSNAYEILMNLLNQHWYLIPLIKHHFIFEVQMKLVEVPHNNCHRCSKFLSMARNIFLAVSEIAESGYGKGEITYQFLKSHADTRRVIAVMLPFIIRNNMVMMKKILVESSGLDLLIAALKDVKRKDNVWFCSAASVAHLSSLLDIPVLKLDGITSPEESFCTLTRQELEKVNSSNSVCFVLDDGTAVTTQKLPLVEQSPMFNAMFLGTFRESSIDTIPLPGLSANVLNYILKYIEERNCNIFRSAGITETLDVLKTLDQFLLPDVEPLMHFIVSKKLTHSTVIPMYCYSAELSSLPRFQSLRQYALNYMLAATMTPQHRRSLFITAMQSPHAEILVDDIRNTFLSRFNEIIC